MATKIQPDKIERKKTPKIAVSILTAITLLSAGGISNNIGNSIKEHRIAGGQYDEVKAYLLGKSERGESFTINEWATFAKVYDYEIKKRRGYKAKNFNTKDFQKNINEYIK